MLLAIIFWMYGGYAWLTNAVAADTAARRLVLLGGMAGFLLVSLTVPEAFDGGGLAFGLAYAVVVLVHIGLFSRTQRVRSASDLVRVGLLNVAGTALILVGGAIGGVTQLVLWILVPLVWWLVSPYRGLSGGFDIGAAHFVERHGLVLIIAIGESLVGLALGLGDLELGPSVAAVAVLGLALSACLWWTYFGGDDTLAEHALAAAPRERRGRMSIEAFGHADLGLLLGVIAIAAGLEAGAHEPFHALDFGHAVALGGGVALYLVSDAWFRQRLRIGRPWPRALAAIPGIRHRRGRTLGRCGTGRDVGGSCSRSCLRWNRGGPSPGLAEMRRAGTMPVSLLQSAILIRFECTVECEESAMVLALTSVEWHRVDGGLRVRHPHRLSAADVRDPGGRSRTEHRVGNDLRKSRPCHCRLLGPNLRQPGLGCGRCPDRLHLPPLRPTRTASIRQPADVRRVEHPDLHHCLRRSVAVRHRIRLGGSAQILQRSCRTC